MRAVQTEADKDITVIIPTFNRGEELVRALQGLLGQTDSAFQVIVCDDGSTEDIAGAIADFIPKLDLRLMRIDNSGGPARPRNVATQAASTRWVSYLDSDDWWFPTRIARVKAELNNDVDVVYHPLQVERADRNPKAHPAHGSRIGSPLRIKDPVAHMIRFGNPFPTSGTTVRRESMLDIGGFEESRELASVEDFDAWLRLATRGARFHYISQAMGAYWVGSDHISTFNERQFERQRRLFERQLVLLPAAYKAQAKSNFSYLLGSYALALNLPGASSYFREVRLTDEPVRWLKAKLKQFGIRQVAGGRE